MPFEAARYSGRLPRLASTHYSGTAFVHWSMTVERRASGWLDALHHARVREGLCHALGRHGVICPAYVLMPDHGHFLWIGWHEQSDQRRAAKLFREAWNRELQRSGRRLQRQAYDHVLRETERERGAFTSCTHYVLENPVRAGLAGRWQDYEHLGAMIPGYPSLDPRTDDFWERFWRIFARLTAADGLTACADDDNEG